MKMKLKNNMFNILLFLLFFLTVSVFGKTGAESEGSLESVIKIMVAVTAFLVAIIMWLVLVYSEKSPEEEEASVKKFLNLINKRPEMSEEHKLLLDHDYDGIKELNNKIPPWFMAIFYLSIIWAAYYMINYHVIGSGNVQEEEYQAEVQAAALEREILNKSGALVNEETVTFLEDAASLSSGEEIYY
jgi:cytochrome c oxidase cbb3-type subunit 3